MAAEPLVTRLPELCGHAELRERFQVAAAGGRLPQSLLLHGPDGIGKQRLAVWIGALVLCHRDPADRPCGDCPSCGMVARLQHPDLHWFFPLPRPKGSHTPTRLRQLLEEAREEELSLRREDPLAVSEIDAAGSIYLAMVDELRARAAKRPAISRSAVFVVGDAERMVPQASSQEAANAFLKLLEEPPADTILILTSSRPGSLLPTIRSRVLAVRVTAPEPAEAAEFLERAAGLPGATARELARRSQGAVGSALRLADADAAEGDEGWRIVRCAVSGSAAERYATAAAFPVRGARGPFTRTLDRVEEVLRECLTASAGSVEFAWHREAPARTAGLGVFDPECLISCLDHVETARRAAAGNGNPQVIAAVLLMDMARELRPGRGVRGNATVPRG